MKRILLVLLIAAIAVLSANRPDTTPHIQLDEATTSGFWGTLGEMYLRMDESTTDWSYTNLIVCWVVKGHIAGKDHTVIGIMNKWYLWS